MLRLLRHRGFDCWGIAGLAGFPFPALTVQHFTSCVPRRAEAPGHTVAAVAHTRYATDGGAGPQNAQPLLMQSGGLTVALVHNGQVCRDDDDTAGLSDTHGILRLLHAEALRGLGTRPIAGAVLAAAARVMARLDGSYACLALLRAGQHAGLLAFRDPRGIRPLCVSLCRDRAAFASESCALPGWCGDAWRDVAPGEAIWVDSETGEVVCAQAVPCAGPTPCLFEYVYLADEQSVIDGLSVDAARLAMAELVAGLVGFSVDVVAAVPRTPVRAAHRVARLLGVPCVPLLHPSKQASGREGRTFILPTQGRREDAVHCKFLVDARAAEQCAGKRLLLVDDSIVRGTTLQHVVRLVRDVARPAAVHVASLAPAVVAPNRFGIAIPDTTMLVAARRGSAGVGAHVARAIGCDGDVVYPELADVTRALLRLPAAKATGFESSVFVPLGCEERTSDMDGLVGSAENTAR